MIKLSTVLTLSVLCAVLPAGANAQDRFGATGIGVADLAASTKFYEDVLGLDVLRTYELGYLNEIVLGYAHADSEHAVVVLMHWPDQGRSYDGSNVKLVFYIDDPAGAFAPAGNTRAPLVVAALVTAAPIPELAPVITQS